jgi:hypothetical protein
MSNLKLFVLGSVFTGSIIHTHGYMQVIFAGEWISPAYALSACVTSALMLGSVIMFLLAERKDRRRGL